VHHVHHLRYLVDHRYGHHHGTGTGSTSGSGSGTGTSTGTGSGSGGWGSGSSGSTTGTTTGHHHVWFVHTHYTLNSYRHYGHAVVWRNDVTNSAGHECAHHAAAGESWGSAHRLGQPASTTAGGLLHLNISL
jgi:hypothetical protein